MAPLSSFGDLEHQVPEMREQIPNNFIALENSHK